MATSFSIIYANRDRDFGRINASFFSLSKQDLQNFEVIFVDYGSMPERVRELEVLCAKFDFVSFFPLEVSQLLWNKSKAINFGILKAKSPYIFIADVDLIFHPSTTVLFKKLASPESFYLFRLGHLSRAESLKIGEYPQFQSLKSSKYVDVNGMILVSRLACEQVNGLDEFFHFYGAEDVDFFARLEKAGYSKKIRNENFFHHNWHKSFIGSEDMILTHKPRVKNIMRINEQHFFRNRELGIIRPLRQKVMGKNIDPIESKLLDNPSRQWTIYNIKSHVDHFLFEELPSCQGEVLKVEFKEQLSYRTWKQKLKMNLGKETQPIYSLKEVNDLLLKIIVFSYRDHNYSFKVQKDLEALIFRIKL